MKPTRVLFLLLLLPGCRPAPVALVGLGDSLIAGHPGNVSRREGGSESGGSLPRYLAEALGGSWVNLGIGGQEVRQIAPRLLAEALPRRPGVLLLNGGLNDLSHGLPEAGFLTGWHQMLTHCRQARLRPLALLLSPWTDGPAVKMAERDRWNADLTALLKGFPEAVLVDPNPIVGTERPGGPKGNRWDLAPAFDADGCHLTPAGYRALAKACALAWRHRKRPPRHLERT